MVHSKGRQITESRDSLRAACDIRPVHSLRGGLPTLMTYFNDLHIHP